MSDSHFDRLKALLDDAGVTYEVSEGREKHQPPVWAQETEPVVYSELSIIVRENRRENRKNIGYGWFFTEVAFDADGNLMFWGTWE